MHFFLISSLHVIHDNENFISYFEYSNLSAAEVAFIRTQGLASPGP